ncbi:hypothetical protein VNO77_19230 [Canavalia gladiata]|uniref:Uncharacterized protein n=1 Tax=Canavalia gladiata TaxID=3824 RepID=A0AAN9LME0_CANGL
MNMDSCTFSTSNKLKEVLGRVKTEAGLEPLFVEHKSVYKESNGIDQMSARRDNHEPCKNMQKLNMKEGMGITKHTLAQNDTIPVLSWDHAHPIQHVRTYEGIFRKKNERRPPSKSHASVAYTLTFTHHLGQKTSFGLVLVTLQPSLVEAQRGNQLLLPKTSRAWSRT